MSTKRSKSRSDAQCAAEVFAVRCFAEQKGIPLIPRELSIDHCKVNVDGYYESEDGLLVVIAEAWAHIGKAIGSQPKKVTTDVFKMVFVAEHLRRTKPGCAVELYMLFIDSAAAKALSANCWAGAAAKQFGVVPHVVSLDRSLADAVSQAQVDQNLVSV
jgi:hypothetical protein